MVAVLAAIEFQEDETNDDAEDSARGLSPRLNVGRGASAPTHGIGSRIWKGLKAVIYAVGEVLSAGLSAILIVALGSRLVSRFSATEDPVVEARVHLFPVGDPS